jgi:uncharacterized phage protein (TIGR01671 family)
MRTIKFRAWNREANLWVEDNYWFLDNDGVHFTRVRGNDEDIVLMQFTGLTDKLGKEIYEGDIVKNQADAKREVKRTEYGEYKLFCGEHSNSFYKGWAEGTEWEVVGNIYENPGLLK